ncbi:hypothetical protein ACFCV3_35835 [Kribbella sp. NPDC056345]|uniref:hypothetical protein n=1 Tax=Kribbella sp. NPDC056345 TaxID=3345789 RepID=UPI0035E11E40
MRYRSLTAALVVLVPGLVLGQQVAEAAPSRITATCSPGVPYKLVVSRPDAYVDFRLGRDCPRTVASASWDVTRPDGYSIGFGCGVGQTCRAAIYELPIGRAAKWEPTSGIGWDKNGRKVADLVPATSMVKTGAAIGLTGVRQGTKTTVYARATYYSTKSKAFTRHHGRVLFQKRDIGSNTWTDLGWAYPNTKTGAASYTIITNRSRDYRVYVPSSSTVWYAYSATKRV